MISLGIDESYTNFGICVVEGTCSENGKIVKVKSFPLKKLKSKTLKRRFVKKLIKKSIEKYNPDVIMVERIRLFSKGFLSKNYLITTGALIATIVDAAYPQKVYSVETKCWKSRIIGKFKGDKSISVEYIKRRFGRKLNDDAADAVCIALFGLSIKKWLGLSKPLAKEES